MSQCQVISPAKSAYSAVNIKINNPRANVADNKTASRSDLNAVNLEINNPELKQKPLYSYPVYDDIITADMIDIMPVEIPQIGTPVAYRTSFTYITSDAGDKDVNRYGTVRVPEPYITTPDNEKKNRLTFNGLSFKRSEKPQIVADSKMAPAVNTEKVVNNLNSKNYDVQAIQIYEIFDAALNDKKSAIPYITAPIFRSLIAIAEKDSSSLNGPTESQIEIRKQFITNKIVERQQLAENKKSDEIVLPYEITPEELDKATVLSEKELVERNKEYAILALSALSKVYAEEYENKTGNKVMLTDLPGASTMVEVLKNSDNKYIKRAAIDGFVYLYCPEYKDEILTILKIASNDSNREVAMYAAKFLKILNNQKS